jgi:hypothetical protein
MLPAKTNKKLKKGKQKKGRYSLSSATAFAVSSAGAPLAARLATIPSFVTGVYAPPVNVKPHFLHFQTPTLSRLTLAKPHCGHL